MDKSGMKRPERNQKNKKKNDVRNVPQEVGKKRVDEKKNFPAKDF